MKFKNILFIFLFLIVCKSQNEKLSFGINPIQGNFKILLGEIKQSSNINMMNLGKLAKDFAAIEVMNQGYKVEIMDLNNLYSLSKKEENRINNKNMILNIAGENNERNLNSDLLDSNIISEIGKIRSFDYFLQGRLHIYKEEFKSNSLYEIVASISILDSNGNLIAAISSNKNNIIEINSEEIKEIISKTIKKIPQVLNK